MDYSKGMDSLNSQANFLIHWFDFFLSLRSWQFSQIAEEISSFSKFYYNEYFVVSHLVVVEFYNIWMIHCGMGFYFSIYIQKFPAVLLQIHSNLINLRLLWHRVCSNICAELYKHLQKILYPTKCYQFRLKW